MIYLGNGKQIECDAYHDTVHMGSVSKSAKNHLRRIIHFDVFPVQPNAYYDVNEKTIKFM